MNRLVEKYSNFSVPGDDPGTGGGDGSGHVVVSPRPPPPASTHH